MGFASLLIFLVPLFKAGVKFRGRNLGLEGVGDHSPTQPRGLDGIPGKGADKAMELLRMHPKYGFRSKPELAEGSAVLGILWGKGGVIKESEYPEEPRGNLSTLWAGRGGAFTLKRNLRRQSFIS